MGLQFYKANPRNTGAGCSFSFNSKDGSLFIGLVKQVSWSNGKGTFKGGDSIRIKFSMKEIGGLINAIETHGNFPIYHDFNGSVTRGNFNLYIDKNTQQEKGFGLMITSIKEGNKKSFSIGFDFAEAILVREYLKFALEHCFSAIYSVDKKQAETRIKDSKKNDKAKIEPPIEQEVNNDPWAEGQAPVQNESELPDDDFL